MGRRPAAEGAQRTDLFGDPLPEGALARLGTIRWRHESLASLAFGSEGKTLITTGGDGTLRIWDVASGKEIRRLGPKPGPDAGHGREKMAQLFMFRIGNSFSTLVISQDRNLLASATGSRELSLWDLNTGQKLRTLEPATVGSWRPVVFSPDGKTLVAEERSRGVSLFDVESAKELRQLYKLDRGNLAEFAVGRHLGAFSPDGKWISWVEQIVRPPRTIRVKVWEVKTGEKVREIALPAPPDLLALSPDGKTVVMGSGRGIISLWDWAKEKEVLQLDEPDKVRHPALAFSSDSKLLALWNGTTIRLLEAATGKEMKSFSDKPELGGAAALRFVTFRNPQVVFSPDGSRLAIGGDGNTVRVWDVAQGTRLGLEAGHQGAISAVALPAGGDTATTVGTDGTVRQWETASGKEIRQFYLPARTTGTGLSSDGRLVGFGDYGDAFHVWEVAKGEETRQWKSPEHAGDGQPLIFSPDGRTMVSQNYNGVLFFWDVATGKERFRRSDQAATGKAGRKLPFKSAPTFSADSRLVAVVYWEELKADDNPIRLTPCAIRLVDGATGQLLREFDKQEPPITAVAFSPDGGSIAAMNLDSTITLWESLTGKKRLHFKVNEDWLPILSRPLTFSPDGRELAAGGTNGSVWMWDTATGKQAARFTGHDGPVSSLAFSADGKTMLSGGADGTALVWPVRTPGSPSVTLEPEQVRRLWADLQKDDAVEAYRAICTLSADPAHTLPVLRKELRPGRGPDAKRIGRIIADLDSDEFDTREKASQELERLDKGAEPAVRRALAGGASAEVRSRLERWLAQPEKAASAPEDLQTLRAVEVLGRIGSTEAKEILKTLAKGAAEGRLTREAKATLERLEKTTRPKP